jgi:hypothetical protein
MYTKIDEQKKLRYFESTLNTPSFGKNKQLE